MPKTKLNRRRFLTGAAGATMALPLLEKLNPTAYAQSGAPHPRRIICLAYGMGFSTENWRPSQVGSDFTLPMISAPLSEFQDRSLFVSNIDQKVTALSAAARTGHPAHQQATLTGTLPWNSFRGDRANTIENVVRDGSNETAEGAANGESVETFIGRGLTRMHGGYSRPSVDLAVQGQGDSAREYSASTFFHAGPNTPVSLLGNPVVALADVFGDVTPSGEMPDPAIRARRLRQQSALDAVRDAFVELRSGLPDSDRRVLSQHAERIRQIELDVARLACDRPSDGGVGAGNMTQTSPLQMAIMANAMGCNLAPVGRVQFVDQHDPDFGIPEIEALKGPMEGWHHMVHRGRMSSNGRHTGPSGLNPDATYAPELLSGFRFFYEQMAVLLRELDAIPEGPDTSVLDNTLVVLCSEFGDSHGHWPRKLGWTMAGNLGGARHGYHFDAGPSGVEFVRDYHQRGAYFHTESQYDTNQMLTSLIHMCGVTHTDGSEVNEFGMRGFSSGTLPVFG